MSTPAISLRFATLDDARAIRDIIAPLVSETHVNFSETPSTVDEIRARIEGAGDKLPWIVAVEADQVIAYTFARPVSDRDGQRWMVEVGLSLAPAARGKRLGTRLYDALLAVLAAQGYRCAMALVVLPNAASEALHVRHGFRRIGIVERAGYKHGVWRDASYWQRHLAPADDSTPGIIRSVREVATVVGGDITTATGHD